MSDIVERLRNPARLCEMADREQIADKIERLGSHVSHLEAHRDDLMAEIERLKAALRRARDMVGHPDNVAEIDAALEGKL